MSSDMSQFITYMLMYVGGIIGYIILNEYYKCEEEQRKISKKYKNRLGRN